MKPSWKLLPRILDGEKTIESRWYLTRRAPWDKVGAGDAVYFKDSGKLIVAKASVSKVLQFENLNPKSVKKLLEKYNNPLGIDNSTKLYKLIKGKKYCILMFLDHPLPIEPFYINKTGFGAMCAWICIDNISSIKL